MTIIITSYFSNHYQYSWCVPSLKILIIQSMLVVYLNRNNEATVYRRPHSKIILPLIKPLYILLNSLHLECNFSYKISLIWEKVLFHNRKKQHLSGVKSQINFYFMIVQTKIRWEYLKHCRQYITIKIRRICHIKYKITTVTFLCKICC